MTRRRNLRRGFGEDAAITAPPAASAAPALSSAADHAAAVDSHPAVQVALANAAAVASGSAPPAPAPMGAAAASALASAALAGGGISAPAVTQALSNAAIVANGGSSQGMPPPVPSPSAAAPLAAAAAKAHAEEKHPAVAAVLSNAAALASGGTPLTSPPKGPEAAAALVSAAKAAEGDHPAVAAVLSNAAVVAVGGTPAPAILANAASDANAAGAHPAVVAALVNGAHSAAGAPPPAPPPVGASSAKALADAAKDSEGTMHPLVTATLAKAAAAAAPDLAPGSKGAIDKAAVTALAVAAKSADASLSPGAKEALATAASDSLKSVQGIATPLSGPPAPGGKIAAAYAEGAPASPASLLKAPPVPPALANLPPEQIAGLQENVLNGLAIRDTTDLQPGESMARGEYIASHASHNGVARWKLVLQQDGDLVLYHGASPAWSAGTAGSGASRLEMQPGGDLALVDEGGARVWSAGTHGSPGAFAVLQDDGSFVAYHQNTPIWSSEFDARTRGNSAHRVGNIFLGGVRHHGRNGHHFQFGAEKMDHLFRRLATVTQSSLPRKHRRGFSAAMTAASGKYSQPELRALMSDFSQDDRAGYAVGLALKQGLRHPQFAHHAQGAHFGFEWRPWMWFGLGRHHMLPPPPPALDGSPSSSPEQALVATLAAQRPSPPPPPPPQDPSQPSPSGVQLMDPLVLPDGTMPPFPPEGFHDWNARRAWSTDRRREWQSRFGLPATGMPGLNDPFVFQDGTAVPLPSGGFRDWGTRQGWEAQQRGVWRQNGGHFPGSLPVFHPGIVAPPGIAPVAIVNRLPRSRTVIVGQLPPPAPAAWVAAHPAPPPIAGWHPAPPPPQSPPRPLPPPPPPQHEGQPYIPHGDMGEDFGATRMVFVNQAPGVLPLAQPQPQAWGPPPVVPSQWEAAQQQNWAVDNQVAFDVNQADADAAAGITPPPMVSASGQFIPAAAAGLTPTYGYPGPTYGQGMQRWGGRRFHGDMGADGAAAAPADPTAAATQLAGAAIGLGASALPLADKKAALSAASGHPHLNAGILLVGAGNLLHKIEGLFHRLVYGSKKDPVTGTVTLAPVVITGTT